MELQQTEKTQKSATGQSEDLTQIRALLDQWESAFKAANFDAIIQCYADDVVAFDMVGPLQFVGKDAYRKSYEMGLEMAKAPWIYRARDRKIFASGDVGFCYCLAECGGTMDGKTSSGWVRHTQCFRKIGGKWLIAHESLSVPIDMKTEKALFGLKPDDLSMH